MKELFKGFYGLSEDEATKLWNDDKTIFVFDTNALLLLYRCEKETRDVFFEQWDKIKDRVWIPYHVCLEFQRNRLTAIKAHVLELKNVGDYIRERISLAATLDAFEPQKQETIKRYDRFRDEFGELETQLTKSVNAFIDANIKRRIDEADFLSSHDTVRDKISEMIGDRMGSEPDEEKIKSLSDAGKIRYEKLIPPGFEDVKDKKESTFTYNGITYLRKYGDWFIWSEVLEHVKKKVTSAVIFVGNDLKDDWIFRTGGQIRGPLEALKTELSEAGNGTELLLYTSSSFLFNANKNLAGNKASAEAIDQLESVASNFFINHFKSLQVDTGTFHDDILASGDFIYSLEKEDDSEFPAIKDDFVSLTVELQNLRNQLKSIDKILDDKPPKKSNLLNGMRSVISSKIDDIVNKRNLLIKQAILKRDSNKE